MGVAILVLLGEAAVGFLSLDLFFRYMDVAVLPRRAGHYATLAVLVCGAGLWGGWQAAGLVGAVLTGLGAPIWWMLWRFGLRKQLTYLYKDDGGHPVHTEKPDP